LIWMGSWFKVWEHSSSQNTKRARTINIFIVTIHKGTLFLMCNHISMFHLLLQY
jgi:hypothetical protein